MDPRARGRSTRAQSRHDPCGDEYPGSMAGGGQDLALTVRLSDEVPCVPVAAEIVGRNPAGKENF